ncbi:MAG TPA: hypothetical protein VGC99_16235 [Candidatus Tectomicrobia bacterium]
MKTQPLSVNTEAGSPQVLAPFRNSLATAAAVVTVNIWAAVTSRE